MFTWISNWRTRRPNRRDQAERATRVAAATSYLESTGYHVYGPDDSALFRYWDGATVREADPFATLRKLLAWQTRIGDQTLADAMAAREPAASTVLGDLYGMFGVNPWSADNPTGLTGWEILRVYREFEDLLAALKKNGSPGPISSEPTGSPSSTSPESPAGPANAPSDCGSTPAASTPAEAG